MKFKDDFTEEKQTIVPASGGLPGMSFQAQGMAVSGWLKYLDSRENIASQSTGTSAQVQVIEVRDEGLNSKVDSLTAKVESLVHLTTAVIHTLGSSKYELRQSPLQVTVEQRGAEEFIACLYDVKLYGYGETIPEAIQDLKDCIVDQYEHLLKMEFQGKLGKMPKEQLDFLKKMLVRADSEENS